MKIGKSASRLIVRYIRQRVPRVEESMYISWLFDD